MSVKLAILTLVFNNFQCMSALASDAGAKLPSTFQTTLFVVDDGSTDHALKRECPRFG